jgi:hypothetical protein
VNSQGKGQNDSNLGRIHRLQIEGGHDGFSRDMKYYARQRSNRLSLHLIFGLTER